MTTPLVQHIVSIVLGLVLIVGTTVAYIPQIIELLCAKTTHGVSFWTYFLSSLAYWLNFVSLFISDYWILTTDDTTVPWEINIWIRVDAWFAVANLLSQFVMPMLIVMTFVFVFLRETDAEWLEKKRRLEDLAEKTKESVEGQLVLEKNELGQPESGAEEGGDETEDVAGTNSVNSIQPSPDNGEDEKGVDDTDSQNDTSPLISDASQIEPGAVSKRDLINRYVFSWVFVVLVVFVALTWSAALLVSQFRWSHRSKIADVLPILASILFFGLWLPQIFLTACCVRGKGSFSVVTLGICFVGTFVCGVYLGISETKWVNWLPYVFLALQQGILFVLIVFFETVKCCKRKKKKSKRIESVTI